MSFKSKLLIKTDNICPHWMYWQSITVVTMKLNTAGHMTQISCYVLPVTNWQGPTNNAPKSRRDKKNVLTVFAVAVITKTHPPTFVINVCFYSVASACVPASSIFSVAEEAAGLTIQPPVQPNTLTGDNVLTTRTTNHQHRNINLEMKQQVVILWYSMLCHANLIQSSKIHQGNINIRQILTRS